MASEVMLSDCIARENGHGAAITLGECRGKPLTFILEITRVLPYGSLQVSILGSAGGGSQEKWRRLAIFPLRSYCGTYVLDLVPTPDVNYLRAQWTMEGWTGIPMPSVFEFSVRCATVEEKVETRPAAKAKSTASVSAIA